VNTGRRVAVASSLVLNVVVDERSRSRRMPWFGVAPLTHSAARGVMSNDRDTPHPFTVWEAATAGS
jgi:hypothetical protein